MDEVYFAFDNAQKNWTQTHILPMPPNFTTIKKDERTSVNIFDVVDDIQEPKVQPLKIFCRVHNCWEIVSGFAVGTNGKKQLVSSCGYLMSPPYIKNYSTLTFGYAVKTYPNKTFLSFSVHNMKYKNGTRIRDSLSFTLSTVTGELENSERNFDVDNDHMKLPESVIEYIIMLVGKTFANDFGFTPTLTSKVNDISVISGYVKYPFNANLPEIQKISGMDEFKVARNDSLNENKMFDFLHIKPSKILRKKYQEFPLAPIVWKFFERLDFKDSNLINPNLGNKEVIDFLKNHWVCYDTDTKTVVFNGDEHILYFVNESRKRNKDKIVLTALLVCLETENRGYMGSLFFSYLFDSIDMIRQNSLRIDEAIKKEIFHDGITERTHENLIHMFQSIDMGLADSIRNMPFPYTQGDLTLEYKEKDPKTEKIMLEFSLPKTEAELVKFGKQMHNCVGWGMYTNKVRSRRATIVAVYVDGKADICLELNESKKIVQALGVCNKRLSKEQRKTIYEWADKKNVKKGVLGY